MPDKDVIEIMSVKWKWKKLPMSRCDRMQLHKKEEQEKASDFRGVDDICEDKTLSQTLNEDIFAMGGWIRTAYVLVCCSFC